MGPTGWILSIDGYFLCFSIRDVMGHISFPCWENGTILWVITVLVGSHVPHGWSCQWVIPLCLHLFLLRPGTTWCPLSRQPHYLWLGIPTMSGYGCPILGMSCAIPGSYPLRICGVIGNSLYRMYMRFEEAGIWCGSPGFPSFWPVLPKCGTIW